MAETSPLTFVLASELYQSILHRVLQYSLTLLMITLHMHARAGGYMIGAGAHIYLQYILYMYMTKNKFE